MIDPESDRPAYKQIADYLRAKIDSGEYPPGSQLPSEERLRQESGTSRTTVRNAVNELVKEGLIEVRAQRGMFVRDKPTEIQTIALGAGDFAEATMPLRSERSRLGLPSGVPVLKVTRADGTVEPYPGDRARVTGR
jgi:DNA-binding FadR family transcriptional regulator